MKPATRHTLLFTIALQREYYPKAIMNSKIFFDGLPEGTDDNLANADHFDDFSLCQEGLEEFAGLDRHRAERAGGCVLHVRCGPPPAPNPRDPWYPLTPDVWDRLGGAEVQEPLLLTYPEWFGQYEEMDVDDPPDGWVPPVHVRISYPDPA